MRQRLPYYKFIVLLLYISLGTHVSAQTILTTGTNSGSSTVLSNAMKSVTFTIENTNSYDIIIYNLDVFRGTTPTTTTLTLQYNASSLSGTTNLTTTPGWVTITSVPGSTVPSNSIQPTFTGINFIIPANTTYRFAYSQSTGTFVTPSSISPNNTTSGGVVLGIGNYQIAAANVGYYGTAGNLATTPRYNGVTISFDPAPLAIKLKDISVKNKGNGNVLNWETASEDMGDKFTLLRSADGNSYHEIGTIDARGIASEYDYKDEQPLVGMNYYRLKLTDEKGSNSFSKVVTATVDEGPFSVEVYPNPVSDILKVMVYGTKSVSATITVSDLTGKLVKLLSATSHKTEIDMKELPKGIYVIRYKDMHHKQTIKVNKQ